MAIVSLNMGNLTLEVKTLKNRLVMGEKEKAMLHEELDKHREFHKGYKHNVEIWRKTKVDAKQKNQVLIKKMQDENEELKGSTTRLKSQDEKLQNLRQKVEIWETIERKWIEALFVHTK
jgi:bacterioferritin (cytochrome b1)